ncbi:MAG: hypothetical protein GY851_26695, partial [bacterium]|nr:hypothetical protein [bacterium]
VTTMLLVDPAREDPASGGTRMLPTEIWYPATDDTRDLPKNELFDFFQGKAPLLSPVLKAAFGADLLAANKIFQNFAVRDARGRDGKFPLVVFSHGNGGLRMQNAFWAEHLASHGYIVAAPDHTGNCAVTFINGKLIPFADSDEGRTLAAKFRPQDVSFVIDTMTHMHKGGDSRFTGRIDLDHIAVSGHSFGGYTSTWVADEDPRVDVIIPMAGVAKDRQGCKIPALILFAAEDDTLGNEGVARIRQYYAACQGPRYSVEFVNAGH